MLVKRFIQCETLYSGVIKSYENVKQEGQTNKQDNNNVS